MEKVAEKKYKEYIEWAEQNTSNRVYPLSVAEGFQTGEIYTDNAVCPGVVLFWHYCGFAYLSGRAEEKFLEEIYERFFTAKTDRRFLIITDDSNVIGYFSEKPGIAAGQRIEYIFSGDSYHSTSDMPHGCSIKKIDCSLLPYIEGRIVPAFSWKDSEQFLQNGFGYAAIEDGKIVSTAFSAAVSTGETDIGVETKEAYRSRGYARMLVSVMCRDILALGKKPVWAHAEQNTASMRTAVSCGFVKTKVNTVIKKQDHI